MNNIFPFKKSPIIDPVQPSHYIKDFKDNHCRFYNDVDFDLDRILKKPMDEYYNRTVKDYEKEVYGVEHFKLPASNNNIMQSKSYKSFTPDELKDKTIFEIDKMMEDKDTEKIKKDTMDSILGKTYDNVFPVKNMYKPVWTNLPPKPFDIYDFDTKYKPYTPLNEGTLFEK